MNSIVEKYNNFDKSNFDLYLDFPIKIKTFVPSPTNTDYMRSYIARHFVTKLNNTSYPIYEISERDRSLYFNHPFFIGVSIDWKISKATVSEVESVNRKSIIEGQKVIPNLNLYLLNLSQFYKEIDF
jgi:hypothetical protein